MGRPEDYTHGWLHGRVWKLARDAEAESTKLKKGTPMKVVMISRLGDVGLTRDCTAENGYEIRVMPWHLEPDWDRLNREDIETLISALRVQLPIVEANRVADAADLATAENEGESAVDIAWVKMSLDWNLNLQGFMTCLLAELEVKLKDLS